MDSAGVRSLRGICSSPGRRVVAHAFPLGRLFDGLALTVRNSGFRTVFAKPMVPLVPFSSERSAEDPGGDAACVNAPESNLGGPPLRCDLARDRVCTAELVALPW